MSTEVKPPVEGEVKTDDGAPKGDTTKPDPQPDWEAKFNDLAAKHRQTAERLKTLEKEAKAKETDELVKGGNADKIRENAQIEIAAEKDRADKAEARLRAVTVEKDVRAIIANLAADGMADDVYTLTKDLFDVSEDGTNAVVKESALSPKQFLEKWFEKKPQYARNPQQAGGGTQKGTAPAPATTIADLAKLPDRGRELLANNPDLAREVLRKG
jgi:hypothetical protein